MKKDKKFKTSTTRTRNGCSVTLLGMKKIFLIFALVFIFAGVSFADDLMNMKMPEEVSKMKDLNMSGLMPNYKGNGTFAQSDTPDFNLTRMKSVNPDFTTYPDEKGIVWLKYSDVASSGNGLEITHLYVILGRTGLDKKWLEWNVGVPDGGKVEILLYEAYDFATLNKLLNAEIQEQPGSNIKNIKFVGLPDVFILTVAWKEILPKQLSVEGLCWFQEDLRVWESIVDIASPQELKYKTFPAVYPVDREFIDNEYSYTWRRINIDPYSASGELAKFQRQGVIFGSRSGSSILTVLLKDIDNSVNVPLPASLAKEKDPRKVLSHLMKHPEIEIAEGSPRKIPDLSFPLTKREKVLISKSWLNAIKTNVVLDWQLPFEVDKETPLCLNMFFSPVVEYTRKGYHEPIYHDMAAPELLAGAKVFGFSSEKLTSKRIPASRSGDNRLSALMELKLSETGLLNGNIRVLLRGAWGKFLLPDETADTEKLNALVLSLFPNLKNFSEIKLRKIKDVLEISFKISDKPGVAGSGKGILAVLPFFEPVHVRKLASCEDPLEILFPFIIDQNIDLEFPKNATEALISGKTARSPDKINYSHAYNNNRKSRLIADARFEVNLQNISGGNMNLLIRCLEQWRSFSLRNIPIR